MKNILIIHGTLNDGGITNILKNYASNISENYHIDLMVFDDSNNDNKMFFQSRNINIYKIEKPQKNLFQMMYRFRYIIHMNRYDTIHCCNSLNSGFFVLLAHIFKIPNIIVHSHSSNSYYSSWTYQQYEKVMKCIIRSLSTKKLACSKFAGEYLFGNSQFDILYNSIATEKFNFNLSDRQMIREIYHIRNSDIVIGTVGMIYHLKNHEFLLHILEKLDSRYKLMIVGDGKEKEKILCLSRKLKIEERVIVTGWVQDTHRYYSAFDFFALPSKSEGFPLVSLEAQANGLICFFSKNITEEVNVNKKNIFITIEEIEPWIKKILETSSTYRRVNAIESSVFDNRINISLLEKIYDNENIN